MSLHREAADEIERLKAELFTMRNVFHQQDAEIERLRERESMCHERVLEQENERLRDALAKSREEGRDEMYDCGYNRLRAALERIANEYLYESEGDAAMFQRWAREALTRG
jgi:hypothetical protein